MSKLTVHPEGQPLPGRRLLHRALLIFALLLAVVGVGAIWLGVDALRARAELAAAAEQVKDLQGQVERGERTPAAATLASLQDNAVSARARTHGPRWSTAAALPLVGVNVRAVQTVTEVFDRLAEDALPSLVDATTLVDPATFAPVEGRVALAPLVRAEPQVVAADAEVQRARSTLAEVDADALLGVIARPVKALRDKVDEVAGTTATASRAVRLIPAMLGAHGPREYLVLVQNNAEQRATGGVPTLIRVRAVDGAVKVVQTRSAGSDLGNLAKPVLPLTAQELALFGDGLGRYMADVTFTPDFPRSGQLARAIWRQQIGTHLDGVISIDPGALAHVLGATGPVRLKTGQMLTSGNAAEILMNTVYLQILDPRKQDEFFAATARTVFDAIAGGQGRPAVLVQALAQSAREGRLMVWSAHQDEQALLAGTVLAGELVGRQGDAPVVGVYLNDGTAAKIGYYLRTDVVVTPTRCQPDGSQTLEVTVTLTSQAPPDAATLPPIIASGTTVPKGEVRMNVLLYAPLGGVVEDVRVTGAAQGVFSQTHDGLAVAGKTVQLKPGERVVLEFTVASGPGGPGRPILRMTPVASGSATVNASVCV